VVPVDWEIMVAEPVLQDHQEMAETEVLLQIITRLGLTLARQVVAVAEPVASMAVLEPQIGAVVVAAVDHLMLVR
jgi:hypothetical protein